MRHRRTLLSGLVLTAGLVAATAACGADNETSGNTPVDGPIARGASLNVTAGCAACHGSQGEGGVGPGYAGLLGSEVELEDGTTVIADSAYIRRSITDPGAEVAAGWEIAMPPNTLTDDEVDDLVAWIESL